MKPNDEEPEFPVNEVMNLNTKRCRLCSQDVPLEKQYPDAVYLPIHTISRQVFVVDGHPGMWIKRPRMCGATELNESMTVMIKAGKGRTPVEVFRQKKLEASLLAVLRLEDTP